LVSSFSSFPFVMVMHEVSGGHQLGWARVGVVGDER
jgi:hypothetical protein